MCKTKISEHAVGESQYTRSVIGILFSRKRIRGFTLIELIVATAILVILTGMAVPVARMTIKREKERQLHRDLWMMRDAIDRYKFASDRGAFQIKVGSEGYPPDLQTLVDGVDVGGKKLKFLRRIPIDPMTAILTGDFIPIRTIRTPRHGMAITFSTFLPSPMVHLWMERNIKIGSESKLVQPESFQVVCSQPPSLISFPTLIAALYEGVSNPLATKKKMRMTAHRTFQALNSFGSRSVDRVGSRNCATERTCIIAICAIQSPNNSH